MLLHIPSLLFFSFCMRVSVGNEITDALMKEVSSLAANTPSNANTYIHDVKCSGSFEDKTIDVKDLEATLTNKWKLPKEFADKFRMATLSKSMTAQSFTFSLKNGNAAYEEYVGAARTSEDGTHFELAYSYARASGNLQQQYEIKELQCEYCCTDLLFFCLNYCDYTCSRTPVARGFKADEISIIEKTLRASAYSYLKNKIGNSNIVSSRVLTKARSAGMVAGITSPRFLRSLSSSGGSSSLIKNAVDAEIAKVPQLENDVKASKGESTLVDSIVDRGFTEFAQSTEITEYDGVDDSNVPYFIDRLVALVSLPAANKSAFKRSLSIVTHASSYQWIGFHIAFAIDNGGACKYLTVFANHNAQEKKVNWLVANIGATFSLAPDIFILRKTEKNLFGFTDISYDFKEVPRAISDKELSTLFAFFDIVAFRRFAEVLSMTKSNSPDTGSRFLVPSKSFAGSNGQGDAVDTVPYKPSAGSNSQGDTKDSDELLKDVIDKVVDQMNKHPVEINSSSKLVGELENLGFDFLDETAFVEKIDGMDADYIETYKEDLIESFGFTDPIVLNQIKKVLKRAGHVQGDSWAGLKVLFSSGTGGSCAYVCILYRRNPSTTLTDWITVNLSATFKAAPRILVVHDTEDVGFAFFHSHTEEDRLVEKPRGLTEKDLNTIIDFFSVVALKRIAELVGIFASYPDFLGQKSAISRQAANVYEANSGNKETMLWPWNSLILVGCFAVVAAFLVASLSYVEKMKKKVLSHNSSDTPLKSIAPKNDIDSANVSYGSIDKQT